MKRKLFALLVIIYVLIGSITLVAGKRSAENDHPNAPIALPR